MWNTAPTWRRDSWASHLRCIYYIEPEGYLVTRFIKAKRLPPEVITRPENIVRVVRKLRLFHRSGPELDGEFNVFRRVEMLTAVSKQKNCKFPFDFDWIMQQMRTVEEALLKGPATSPHRVTTTC